CSPPLIIQYTWSASSLTFLLFIFSCTCSPPSTALSLATSLLSSAAPVLSPLSLSLSVSLSLPLSLSLSLSLSPLTTQHHTGELQEAKENLLLIAGKSNII